MKNKYFAIFILLIFSHSVLQAAEDGWKGLHSSIEAALAQKCTDAIKFDPPLKLNDIEVKMLSATEGLLTLYCYMPSQSLEKITRSYQPCYYVGFDKISEILQASNLEVIKVVIPSFEAELLEVLLKSEFAGDGYLSLFSIDADFIYLISIRIINSHKGDGRMISTQSLSHRISIR